MLAACARTTVPPAISPAGPAGTLAQIYFWRARPGKLAEYSRYVRDVAEPIDREAQRRGAFLAVTTYVSRDSATPWSHMRVFILRDSAQLIALGPALDSAGIRLEPDSAKRRVRGEYAATLRDRVGSLTVELLRAP
ncbi:MAG TPA: hypothetical protein VGP61_06940 [Gemmatimonadales bacterium]|jgi:hypothetical protein|nr:hypothetical protein [Gemmatimonadales bacterium]